MLIQLGYIVEGPVATLNEAVATAQQADIDVAVLDFDLYGEEIHPVAEALDARGIAFVLITGFGAGDARTFFSRKSVLTKPFRLAALGAALESVRQPAL